MGYLIGRYIGAGLLMVAVFCAPVVVAGGTLTAGIRRGYSELSFGLVVPFLALLGMVICFSKKRSQPGRWVAAASLAGLVAGIMTTGLDPRFLDLSGTPLEDVELPRVSIGDTQWSLPTDDADAAIEIIRRRIANARQQAPAA